MLIETNQAYLFQANRTSKGVVLVGFYPHFYLKQGGNDKRPMDSMQILSYISVGCRIVDKRDRRK